MDEHLVIVEPRSPEQKRTPVVDGDPELHMGFSL